MSTISTIARYNFDKSGFPPIRLILEAVVAMPKFRGEALTELALHPITLGSAKPAGEAAAAVRRGELGLKFSATSTKLSAAMRADRREERGRLRRVVGNQSQW